MFILQFLFETTCGNLIIIALLLLFVITEVLEVFCPSDPS